MPNKRLFTSCDKNHSEIKSEDNSALFIHVQHLKTNATLSLDDTFHIHKRKTDLKQEMALEKHEIRRPRSQTLPNLSSMQARQSTKRIETPGTTTKTKKTLRLTKSLDFEPQHRRTPKPPTRRRARSVLQQNQAKTACLGENQRSIQSTQALTSGGASTKRMVDDMRLGSNGDKSRSFSMPSSEELQSIYSIVKARSIALQWYRRGSITGKHRKAAKRKETSLLPTIMDDNKNISLCKAKCSPQFAQVVHLLQDEVDLVESDLHLLSLE